MRQIVLYALLLLYGSAFSQENALPNQITLWNPYDLKFTPDNKYLVVTSPTDAKVWNLQNLECLSVKPSFYRESNNDNLWSYLEDTNSFYFHQSAVENEVYKVDTDGKSWSVVAELGKGDYGSYRFESPPSYFLNSNTFLLVKPDKKYLPYISVQQLGNPKELVREKIEGKNPLNVANRHFTVLKGEGSIYYLLSFRSAAYSENGEGVVTEVNIETHKTRVIASGIQVYVGDNSDTNSRIESLKRSFETPGFVVLNLDGFIYAVRKSDGKVLANADIVSKFPANSYPKICGEREGKLVTYSFDTGEKKGFVFHTFDFDSQSIVEQVFHFGIDLLYVKNFKIAISRNGKEIAIAYKWDEDQGFKVAYIDAQKMTMLRDRNNTVENFLKEQVEIKKANELAQQKKDKEIQDKIIALRSNSREKAVTREWYAILSKDNNRQGLGLQLYCDASGKITGLYEYQGANADTNYSLIFNVTGYFTSNNAFVINLVSLYNKTENINESDQKQRTLNFEIMINPQTKSDYIIYCKEYQGSFLEGNLDKHFFN
jgi:hypothetical protein